MLETPLDSPLVPQKSRSSVTGYTYSHPQTNWIVIDSLATWLLVDECAPVVRIYSLFTFREHAIIMNNQSTSVRYISLFTLREH